MQDMLFHAPPPRLSAKSFEWYTPGQIIAAARRVLGDIELDPASCALANQTVRADRFLTWPARSVWLNPPYCKTAGVSNQELWTVKLIQEYEADQVEQALLLVNAATETRWFQRLFAYPMCFIRGRLRFTNPQNIDTGATVGSTVVYFGPLADLFFSAFDGLGSLVLPALLRSTPQLWEV